MIVPNREILNEMAGNIKTLVDEEMEAIREKIQLPISMLVGLCVKDHGLPFQGLYGGLRPGDRLHLLQGHQDYAAVIAQLRQTGNHLLLHTRSLGGGHQL
jgi:hypothetical protein